MSNNLSPYGLRALDAMNSQVYKMSEEDRIHWFMEHPVSLYEPKPVAHCVTCKCYE